MSKLDEVFDIEPVEVIHSDGETTIVPDGDEDTDHLYARARHYELAERGSEALTLAMKIAREKEDPRSIEVLSGLIKNLAEVNKSLLSLNKDKADISAVKRGKSSTPLPIGNQAPSTTNIIFAGNSRDLHKIINEQIGNRVCT